MDKGYNEDDYLRNKIKLSYKNNKRKDILKNASRNRRIMERKQSQIHKIYSNINNRIYKTFKKHNLIFDKSYAEILGCSIEILECHIRKQFKEGMTFDNYGEWEIDHIIPVSSFSFNNDEDVLKCFNYNNLQPLWRKENRSKFNNIN